MSDTPTAALDMDPNSVVTLRNCAQTEVMLSRVHLGRVSFVDPRMEKAIRYYERYHYHWILY
jgi:hypothetical protein